MPIKKNYRKSDLCPTSKIIRRRLFIILTLVMLSIQGQILAQKVKIACIGDSVTFGYGISPRDSLSYPAQLQGMLGNEYLVKNFGKNGATLLRNGHNPYFKSEAFQNALEFVPDITIIHLGLNDTDPRNWPPFQDEFESDYAFLIDTLRAINPKVRVLIAELSPIFSGHPRFKSGTRDWHKDIRKKIRQVAQDNQVELLNFYTPLHKRPDLFPDQIHPTSEGTTILARKIHQTILKDFGGISLDPIFQNGAVLQRGETVRISGKGNPADSILITMEGKSTKTISNQDGEWVAQLKDLKPGGPYSLEVSSIEEKIYVDSLWIGDVWLAMGQSNMEWSLANSNGGVEAAELKTNQEWPKVYKFHSKVPMNDVQWDNSALQSIQNLDFFDANWISGTGLKSTSGIGYFFGKTLHENLQVPIGIIQIAVGGAPLESFLSRTLLENDNLLVDMLRNWEKSDFIMPWVRQRVEENLRQSFESYQRHPFEPAYLHESIINQIMNHPIKGVLWYQGESNVHNPMLYERMFKIFIEDIREVQNDLTPVYMVQLPGILRREWPYFREMQANLASSIPNTHLIVTLDLGDSLDVHPTNKEAVGKRLANMALAETYQLKRFPDFPSFSLIEVKDHQIVITFQSTGDLTTTDQQPIRGIELVGLKGKKIQVEAFASGKTVIINVPKGFDTKEIWYCFSPFPSPNLTDDTGLAIPPFRRQLNTTNSL